MGVEISAMEDKKYYQMGDETSFSDEEDIGGEAMETEVQSFYEACVREMSKGNDQVATDDWGQVTQSEKKTDFKPPNETSTDGEEDSDFYNDEEQKRRKFPRFHEEKEGEDPRFKGLKQVHKIEAKDVQGIAAFGPASGHNQTGSVPCFMWEKGGDPCSKGG
ncbi:hypothetical protein M9H77_14417 [Catharanthus roseus]|uniref:Uncharacterized protein n=1 Tax=Catharanthus roseus TaxID=4058 RepID=A0ACC0BN89_CATRO|nr:hypothetical protein M9H77_14417 [Catharanthus roseus]